MSQIMELSGWIGTILLATCGLPQLVKSFRDGHSLGISWLFILAWFFGELFLLFFIIFNEKGIILILNYSINLVFAGGILYYKIFPKTLSEVNGSK